jgi:hypothetical protein
MSELMNHKELMSTRLFRMAAKVYAAEQEGWGFALEEVKTAGPYPRWAHGAGVWRLDNPGSIWLTNFQEIMSGAARVVRRRGDGIPRYYPVKGS